MPSTANASLMRQNKELASKVADLQTALVQHKPVPQQQLALPSNVIASSTSQENELESKVSLLEAALQKAEQEVSSAKTALAKPSNLETALQKAKQDVNSAKIELSKMSNLETALQKAEQEASSAKTELLEMQANLDKLSKQGANAPDFGNLDLTVRAKVLVDRK
jgi:chromosome segregation ATPase